MSQIKRDLDSAKMLAASAIATVNTLRHLDCPVCKVPYIKGLCHNPKCWVDSNPKPIS